MISCVTILGNTIHCFAGYREFYDFVLASRKAHSQKSGYVTVNNVHTIMEAFRSNSYQQIINNGFLSIPDGKPLEIVSGLKGNKDVTRLFGPTVMERFIDWGRNDNVSHFFFGSSAETLQKLQTAIETKYPGAKIAGMIAPPYKPANEWDNKSFLAAINAAKPDFIWVGLGAPKQEKWMFAHTAAIKKGTIFGIGAGFDYLAGNVKHAPEWMKKLSLEWFYRLVQEPKRLWRRYLTTIPPFLFFVSLELTGLYRRKGQMQKVKTVQKPTRTNV